VYGLKASTIDKSCSVCFTDKSSGLGGREQRDTSRMTCSSNGGQERQMFACTSLSVEAMSSKSTLGPFVRLEAVSVVPRMSYLR
jgi:hypothetical protein